MRNVGQYIERAFRAAEANDSEDLLLQLFPVINHAAAVEYGSSGRSSFKRFVGENLGLATRLGFGNVTASIQNMNTTVRVDGFSPEAQKRLRKVAIPYPKYPDLPDAIAGLSSDIVKQHAAQKLEHDARKARFDNGEIVCVPLQEIVYHCLRCEVMHGPGIPDAVVITNECSFSSNEKQLQLPMLLFKGYILVAIVSPAYADVRYPLTQTLRFPYSGFESRLDWLWGRRGSLLDLVAIEQAARRRAELT